MRSRDATQTLTLRNSAIAESNRRFKAISVEVAKAFLPLGDENGILVGNVDRRPRRDSSRGRVTRRRASLQLSSPILSRLPSSLGRESTPNSYRFLRTRSVEEFDAFLESLIQAELLQPTLPNEQKWLVATVGVAYNRGAAAARNKIRPQVASLNKLVADFSPFAHPAHIERSRLIFERNFNGLKGISEAMKGEMRKVLSDGIIRGKSSREIAGELDKRINVGKVRANRLARTEIIEAHQEASIQETEILEAELGVEFHMEWSTTKDGRQRDSHNSRDGKIYTKEKARSLLGEPNCRCAVFPSIKV